MTDLDLAGLSRWARAALPCFPPKLRLERLSDGQSNTAYRLDAADRSYVLRRKSFGAQAKVKLRSYSPRPWIRTIAGP